MFFEFLRKIQQKPEGYKRTFAISFSFAFTIAIFSVWFSVNVLNFKYRKIEEKSSITSNNPLGLIKESFSNAKATISDSLKVFKNTFATTSVSTTTTDLPYAETFESVEQTEIESSVIQPISSSPVIILPIEQE